MVPEVPQRWVVDAMNVVGSVPDGWWRDRALALARLVEGVRAWAEREGATAVVVLDADPGRLAGRHGPVDVRVAARRGRDAADDDIAALARPGDRVVTSDAALAARVRAAGAEVVGARSFRAAVEGRTPPLRSPGPPADAP